MGTLLQDCRYSLRRLAKRPGFAVVALVTVALGIGANTAIFSVVNAVLLRQLPFKDPDRLIWVWSTRTDRDKAFFSIPNFVDCRDQTETLDQMAAFTTWGANLAGTAPERLQGVRVSAHAFQMLGVEAALGRTLLPEDDRPQSPRVVVLSHAVWQRTFGANPNIIGQQVALNGDSFTVAGVLPANFIFPGADAEIAVPLNLDADPRREERGSNFIRVFGRLKPGVSIGQAQAEMAAISDRLRQQYPDTNAKHAPPRLLPLRQEIVGDYQGALVLLMGAVGLVLLIACSNLASLLLARASTRQREIAIRSALGASRARLIGQLLTESMILAVIGGALGLLLSVWGVDWLLALGPADLPRAHEVGFDARVLGFGFGLSLLAGAIFGVLPAFQASKADLNTVMKESRGVSDPRARTRSVLVTAEVALSLVLLIGAGLLIKSFARLQSVAPGFEPENLLAVRISLPASRYSNRDAVKLFYEKLELRLAEIEGVEAAGAANVLPLSGANVRTDFTIIGRPPRSATEVPGAQNRWVSPGYFGTMKIPILQGRDFAERDDANGAAVAIVDESLARRYWGDESPVGSHLLVDDGGSAPPRDVLIVGVAGDVKHSGLNDGPAPTLYSPMYQIIEGAVPFLANSMNVVVRTRAGAGTLASQVRRELRSVDPDVPASSTRTMVEIISASIAARRFNLLLLTIFAVVAVLLAATGLYGLISYSVTQRTKELGVRLALGAGRGDVLKLVMKQGVKLALAGVAAGLAGSLALSRLMSGLLFDVGATDPLTFATVPLLLAGVALAASFIPALRATKVDPIVALRCE